MINIDVTVFSHNVDCWFRRWCCYNRVLWLRFIGVPSSRHKELESKGFDSEEEEARFVLCCRYYLILNKFCQLMALIPMHPCFPILWKPLDLMITRSCLSTVVLLLSTEDMIYLQYLTTFLSATPFPPALAEDGYHLQYLTTCLCAAVLLPLEALMSWSCPGLSPTTGILMPHLNCDKYPVPFLFSSMENRYATAKSSCHFTS